MKCTKNSPFQIQGIHHSRKKQNVAAVTWGERAWIWGLLCGGRHDTLLTSDCCRWPSLAITSFSHTAVVACVTDSALHQCKRGGITCNSVLVLHFGEKKAQNDKNEQLRTKSCSGKLYPSLSLKWMRALLLFSDRFCAAIAAVSCQRNSCLPKGM